MMAAQHFLWACLIASLDSPIQADVVRTPLSFLHPCDELPTFSAVQHSHSFLALAVRNCCSLIAPDDKALGWNQDRLLWVPIYWSTWDLGDAQEMQILLRPRHLCLVTYININTWRSLWKPPGDIPYNWSCYKYQVGNYPNTWKVQIPLNKQRNTSTR